MQNQLIIQNDFDEIEKVLLRVVSVLEEKGLYEEYQEYCKRARLEDEALPCAHLKKGYYVKDTIKRAFELSEIEIPEVMLKKMKFLRN